MSAVQEPSRSQLLAEVDRLRAEVERLHDLMGFNARTGDGHRRAWAPSLFGATAATSGVTEASSLRDKVDLVRSLFGARSDVYARRWENPSTGKSGWSPAVRGGWSNRGTGSRDYLPLDAGLIPVSKVPLTKVAIDNLGEETFTKTDGTQVTRIITAVNGTPCVTFTDRDGKDF